MAKINAGRTWPDGDRVWLLIKADKSTEGLMQARLIAGDLFREMCAIVIDAPDGDADVYDPDGAIVDFGIDLADGDD